jgi:hypothetical protein
LVQAGDLPYPITSFDGDTASPTDPNVSWDVFSAATSDFNLDLGSLEDSTVGIPAVPESPAWGAIGIGAVALVGILSRRKTKLFSKA